MKLWKENKLNKEYEMSDEEIYSLFLDSRFYQDYLNDRYWRLDEAIRCFISFSDGLNSAFETNSKDFDELMKFAYSNPR